MKVFFISWQTAVKYGNISDSNEGISGKHRRFNEIKLTSVIYRHH